MPFFQPTSLSVFELTSYLKELLDSDDLLRDVWVQGEISNLSRPTSGHLYFTLKDSRAALRCVIWKGNALRIRFGLQNGMAVEAHGAIGIYERDGQYQLYIDGVRPAGEGLLFREFVRLKAQLEAEGLFDSERKRLIPQRPRCVGIITSPTGAALQDMLNTLRLRYPLVDVVVSPCAVQGEAAPDEIVAALGRLCLFAQPDVIIVARGGGSLEDLWAFNDERVVRAVAAAPVPVISGIGHETDFTLVDFASDLRAPTPTGAAVAAVPDRAELQADLIDLIQQLGSAVLQGIDDRRQTLRSTSQQLEHFSPDNTIRDGWQAVDQAQQRMARALAHTLQLHHARLLGLQSRLAALSPAAVLQRGYAIVERADGTRVSSTQQVHNLDTISIRLRDGIIHSVVSSTQKEEGEDNDTRSNGTA